MTTFELVIVGVEKRIKGRRLAGKSRQIAHRHQLKQAETKKRAE